jgi:UDP-glucose 4-epimerase
LLPYVTQVAVGKLKQLAVYGDDYKTLDGTGIRDYIHVVDLAAGHLKALDAIQNKVGVHVWNLGTGRGYSVLELVRAFEELIDRKLPYRIAPRRAGDIAVCYADPSKASEELGWQATRSLEEMLKDAWHWQQKNPNGFAD